MLTYEVPYVCTIDVFSFLLVTKQSYGLDKQIESVWPEKKIIPKICQKNHKCVCLFFSGGDFA
jgi:hypothetical protein